MKTVAQTVIEADRFYTIAAHTGNVIQAVEASKDGGTVRLGKYDHKPEQEWSFVRVGEGVYRIRNRASGKLIDLMMTGTANGTWLHLWETWAALPRCGRWNHPGRHRPPALHVGCRQVHRHRGHGYCGWRCAPDLAGDCGEDQLWTISEVKDRAKHAPKAEEKPLRSRPRPLLPPRKSRLRKRLHLL